MPNDKNRQLNVIMDMGVPPEEAAEDLRQAEEDAKNLSALQANRHQKIPREDVLGCLADKYTLDEETHITAAHLGEELIQMGHQLESFRHLGGFLGNGPNGLNLESQQGLNGKHKAKRYYKIRDPLEFGSWYNGEITRLPKSYYSEVAYRLLLAKRFLKESKSSPSTKSEA